MRQNYSDSEIRNLAEYLIEDLRECEDGTVTSTYELAKKSGYEDLDFFELDNALRRSAKENKIILDMSEHDGQAEGLPYNLTFTVHNQKAQIKCPRCGSTNTARYIYGYPLNNAEMQKKLDEGKWALGGCCIYSAEVNGQIIDIMPSRYCNDCHKDFGASPVLLTPKKDLAEDYRDIVKAIELSIGGYLYGYTDITISKK
ncbi:MAG TPA: hypothetical protein DCG51_04435 [Erysipelotrichaceae bacterium]|nr:hypothetical protein [Erysipelotrichaceae bacterium]